MPLPLPLQLRLRQVVSLWQSSCKWHQLRPLAFLRKHFANETDTSSVSCRTSGQFPVASFQLPVPGRLWAVFACCRIVVPSFWFAGRCSMPHLPHSKATYGAHKNVKRTTFATLPPFGHKEMEHARGSVLPEVQARQEDPMEIGCQQQQVLCHLSCIPLTDGNGPMIILVLSSCLNGNAK